MINVTSTNVRTRLRYETRAAHEQLDDMVSDFDLTTQRGLACFLQMQIRAFSSLQPHAYGTACQGALGDLTYRANCDLARFEQQAQSPVQIAGSLHPHAIDYVVAGSRLGTQVLKKRWLATTDDRVREADAYFSAPAYIGVWKAFCAAAEAMSATGTIADTIIDDVHRIFALYKECARASQSERGTIVAGT